MAWLTGLFTDPTTAPAAYGLVILLLVLIAVFTFSRMRHARHGMFVAGGRKQRLAVIDATAIDNRRRLVLVRRDSVEHLLLIGGHNDLVVESPIAAQADDKPAQKTVPVKKAPSGPAVAPPKRTEPQPTPAPKPVANPVPKPEPRLAPEPAAVKRPAPQVRPVQQAVPSEPAADRPSQLPVAAATQSPSSDDDVTRTVEAEMERLLGGLVEPKSDKR